MNNVDLNKKRLRFRMIVPEFPPLNIYSLTARTTTSSGPIYIATAANKLEMWEAEVIDENNLHGNYFPKDTNGKLDHVKLQNERPADVVGFYGSISSTVPRLYQLAKVYKDMGVLTVTGGKHVENLPEETLNNNLDIVVQNEGDITIREILLNYQKGISFNDVHGILYLENGKVKKNPKRELIQDLDKLPLPDFNLLRYAKMRYYPISRTRGCNSNCEFCAVKDKARCASPQWLMSQIEHLVENNKATHFFEASDHFAANRDEAIEFCNLYAKYQKKIGKKLITTVQIRITDAKYPELLQAMKEANINTCAIGYESPIDEELIDMKKGYLSKNLIKWTNTFHEYGMFIHGMFIFGYPKKDKSISIIPLQERVKRYKNFIKKAKIDTVQLLLTIPLPGTELRKRLIKENRLFPLEQIGWKYYDGQYPLFEPDDGVSPEELQKSMTEIMSKFYHFKNFFNLTKNIIFNFPRVMFFPIFTILTGKVKYINKAFNKWYNKYYRNNVLKFGGYIIVQKWLKEFNNSDFHDRIRRAQIQLNNLSHKKIN